MALFQLVTVCDYCIQSVIILFLAPVSFYVQFISRYLLSLLLLLTESVFPCFPLSLLLLSLSSFIKLEVRPRWGVGYTNCEPSSGLREGGLGYEAVYTELELIRLLAAERGESASLGSEEIII